VAFFCSATEERERGVGQQVARLAEEFHLAGSHVVVALDEDRPVSAAATADAAPTAAAGAT
jgi:hypothetical protein